MQHERQDSETIIQCTTSHYPCLSIGNDYNIKYLKYRIKYTKLTNFNLVSTETTIKILITIIYRDNII